MAAETALRIAIVEDQVLFRDLLASRLDNVDGFSVVVSAENVFEARKAFAQQEVDLAVLDIDLPDGNGIGLGLSLRREHPDLKIVLLSSADMLELMLGLPVEDRKGWSYLSKSSTTNADILISTIRTTARGMTVIDPFLVDRSVARPETSLAKLTKRQYEVLRAVARGANNQSIAEEMGLSVNSVVNHLTAIYAALEIPEGANARVMAVLRFLEETSRTAA